MAGLVPILEEKMTASRPPLTLSGSNENSGTALVLQTQRGRVMTRLAHLIAGSIVAATVFSSVASAQVNLQTTPQPNVTAENETWYHTGEPIIFAGNLYYPAGPATHFNGGEMVRSGFYRGIPLYSRTTIEPYSVVFVPIGGGMMQPYERRRTGQIAGTSGSTVSALPVEISPAVGPSSVEAPILEAPAPPVVASQSVLDQFDVRPSQPAATRPAPRVQVRPPSPAVGTTGRVANSPVSPATRIRPHAANGIFVEFNKGRWYSSGPPVSLDPRLLTRIGDWHGFPVYVAADAGDSTIYIPIAQWLEMLSPYSNPR
jgi:hypothetical protein